MRLQRALGAACSQRAFFRRSKHKDETVHCAVSPETTHLFRRRQQGGDHVYFLSAYQNSSRRPNVRDVKYHISGDSAVAYRWKRSRIHRGMNAACPDHLGPCHAFRLAILSLLIKMMETITISYCAYYDKSDVRLLSRPWSGTRRRSCEVANVGEGALEDVQGECAEGGASGSTSGEKLKLHTCLQAGVGV